MNRTSQHETDRENDARDLNHLCTIARRGKHAGASGGEKQARAIVLCLLSNAIGIDRSATAGIIDLIDMVQASPQDGADAIRTAIQ